MNKSLKVIQIIFGLIAGSLVFYLLRGFDYYGAVGIGILWAIAAYLGIQAFHEWGNSKDTAERGTKSVAEPPPAAADTDNSWNAKHSPLVEWNKIKTSLYVIRLRLEENNEIEERKRLAKDFMRLLQRYDDLLRDHGDKIPDAEKLDVIEDMKACSAIFKETGE